MGQDYPDDDCVGRDRLINRVGFVTRSLLAGVAITTGFLFHGVPNLGLGMVIFILPVLARDRLLIVFLKNFGKFYIPFAAFLFVIYSFFLPSSGTTVLWCQFTFNRSGFILAIQIAQQVAVLTAMLVILYISSEPSAVVRELRQKGVPQLFCYIISAGFFLVPLLKRQVSAVRQAQKARGVEIDGNIVQRAWALIPLLGPLLNSILTSLDERAVALEARGFILNTPKTSINAYREHHWEAGLRWGIFFFGLLLVAGAWMI